MFLHPNIVQPVAFTGQRCMRMFFSQLRMGGWTRGGFFRPVTRGFYGCHRWPTIVRSQKLTATKQTMRQVGSGNRLSISRRIPPQYAKENPVNCRYLPHSKIIPQTEYLSRKKSLFSIIKRLLGYRELRSAKKNSWERATC